MQDTQKPNPTILSREYISSLIRRPTLYCHHQLRLTLPQPFPGEAGMVPCTTCAQTPRSSPGEGFTKAAGSAQPHAGRTAACKGMSTLPEILLLLTDSSPSPEHPSDLLHGNSQQKSAAVPLYLHAVPVKNKVVLGRRRVSYSPPEVTGSWGRQMALLKYVNKDWE